MAKLKTIWQTILGSEPGPKYCFRCGAANPPGGSYCVGCGAQLPY